MREILAIHRGRGATDILRQIAIDDCHAIQSLPIKGDQPGGCHCQIVHHPDSSDSGGHVTQRFVGFGADIGDCCRRIELNDLFIKIRQPVFKNKPSLIRNVNGNSGRGKLRGECIVAGEAEYSRWDAKRLESGGQLKDKACGSSES